MHKLIFPLLLLLTIHQLQSQDILVMMGGSTNQLSKAEGMAVNLEATGAFDNVDAVVWDAINKYDMNFLNEYDAILVVTDGGYNSSYGMGTALKTYVDNGGGVGIFLFANASIQIGGSWNYHALEPAGQSMGPTNFGTIDIPTHSALNYPFNINTSTWNIGSLWSSTSNTLAAEAYSIAKFSDGRPALQARENVGVNGTGRVIDFAVSPLAANANNTTAGYQLFANIMTWLTGSIQITGSTCLSTNSFSFSFLNDGGSPIVSYDWDFGDTTSSSDPTPNKVYTVAGEYDITLTVVRQDASSDIYTDKIKIWDNPTIANAGDDLHLFTGTTTASLIGNMPNIGTGVWSRLSGPNTPTESISDNVLDLSNLTQGTYEYEWEVSNGTCSPSSDLVRIIISDNVAPTLELTGDFTKATDSDNCFYTVQGTEFDPSTATDDSGSLASLTYSLQKLTPNPNLILEDFNSNSWNSNNFELGTNTGSVVNGAYKSDTSSRGTLRTAAEFVPTLANPLYVSATLSYTGGEGIAFVGTRSTGEQPSGQFNSEPQGLNLRIHNFNDGQTSTATGYDLQPRPGNAFYTNPVRFEIIDDGASMSVTMTNLVTGDSHSFSYNTNYTSGSNRVVFSGDYSVSWDDIQISIGAHEYIQEYQNGSNSVFGITLEPGENTIVWRAEDAEGMETIKSQIITVEDTVDPIVITQNVTITLDNNGEASITPSEINNNSTDNCGIDSFVLDKEDFTVVDTGDNTVTLTVTDLNGNVNTATATVTVINPDIDNDGINDDIDNCPLIANADQADNDVDGEGDVCDTDDDNDGTPDTEDAFPFDPTEDTDSDNDGTGDNADTDDDNDGTPDAEDAFPLDPTEDTDTDNDGTGDNADTDDDNDGTPDAEDAFPLDPTEDTDTDNDGTGDNADTDDDNDGTLDTEDAFPLDPTEDTDTDNDGTGDNADLDDDGDGQSDEDETDCGSDPLDASSISADADNDSIPDCVDGDFEIEDNDPDIEEEGTIVYAQAFTPNGDNINDTWIIQGIEKFPSAVVTVFNRYGNEVFKTTNYNNNWDGRRRSNSEKLPPGSYYFVIDLHNGKAPVNGWLFLNY
tara:strand:- start:88377 stop:91634 length:3258 start_codon:yes stop_codon:yes gene_type:complete